MVCELAGHGRLRRHLKDQDESTRSRGNSLDSILESRESGVCLGIVERFGSRRKAMPRMLGWGPTEGSFAKMGNLNVIW